jgi:hypothetical protein
MAQQPRLRIEAEWTALIGATPGGSPLDAGSTPAASTISFERVRARESFSAWERDPRDGPPRSHIPIRVRS